jgi:hypothetical protein
MRSPVSRRASLCDVGALLDKVSELFVSKLDDQLNIRSVNIYGNLVTFLVVAITAKGGRDAPLEKAT